MFSVHQVSKSFNLTTLFTRVSFSLQPGERVGLIGPNGSGKTTLLRILAGEETADEGHVQRQPGLRIGYLPQGFELNPHASLKQVIGQAAGDPDLFEAELILLAAQLLEQPSDAVRRSLQSRYDQVLQKIVYSHTADAAAILANLGLDKLDPFMPCGLLSGGQKTRLSLALVLLDHPEVLLLDEPTNHLDIAMLEWLESWLGAFPGAILIISHDRTFLDRTVQRILEIDPLTQRLNEFNGGYSDYLEGKLAIQQRQWAAFRDRQEEIRRIRQDISQIKEQARYTERQASSVRIGGLEMKAKGAKDYHRSMAKKTAAKAKVREKKLERYLESTEQIEKPAKAWHMKLAFESENHHSHVALRTNQLCVGYNGYPLLSEVSLELRSGQRIVLTGPNGSGKTTLLRTIVGEILPLSGEVLLGAACRLGFMSQEQADLDPELSPLETILAYYSNETEARTYLSYYLFTGDEPLKQNTLLSYGQRARLALALLVAQGCNCLLLDEPVNHLDIPSRTEFESALARFPGAVLAVVHDRFFIERFAEQVWLVDQGQVRVVYRRLEGIL